jgi:hypothetical protein
VSRYSADVLATLSAVVKRWQHGDTLTSHEGVLFNTLITNVCNDRWNAHFGRSKRDWTDTKLMREEVPLVFLQYLKMRKSVRLAGGKCCPIDTPVYPTLPLTLYEFRRQFPRIVSVLTANHVGITLLKEYEPRNVCYMVRTPVYTDLHNALCIMRRLSREQGTLLYGPQRHTLLRDTFKAMYTGHRLPTAKEVPTNRVATRRLLVVNAASDILASRSLSHYDACHNQPVSNYLQHLTENNTNMERM